MKNQLIPPPELAPPSIRHLPMEKRIECWALLADESEQLLLSGLRRRIGPNGDLNQAYRQWYSRRMEEHDRTMEHFLSELHRREENCAR
ncbi:MAG TPA: hypothetical protein VFE46_12895 [Pirellulales bacterium]|jgi:hypothetical protein|nr:hypothetical protein [Pirellulales bacterium]